MGQNGQPDSTTVMAMVRAAQQEAGESSTRWGKRLREEARARGGRAGVGGAAARVEAFAQGRLSYSQVRAITPVTTLAIEATLVDAGIVVAGCS